MKRPILSPEFTMDDLSNLREYNSLRHKDMTLDEIRADLKPGVDEFNARIDEIRRESMARVSR